jgi:signal transduction histidine kinase
MISDGVSIQRILVELLTNACKYTPTDGTIAFTVREADETTAVAQLCFQVQNSGEITADALPRLFEKFYRVPGDDYHKCGGTGLGLALVHHLVEQLQGNISVRSDQGWTNFTVTLPCEISPYPNK